MRWNRSRVSHNSWLLRGGFLIMDTFHWIVFMVAGFCVFWFFSFYGQAKREEEKEKWLESTS